MVAAGIILLIFGVASLPLTYLCSFLFTDEMKALQVRPFAHRAHIQAMNPLPYSKRGRFSLATVTTAPPLL